MGMQQDLPGIYQLEHRGRIWCFNLSQVGAVTVKGNELDIYLLTVEDAFEFVLDHAEDAYAHARLISAAISAMRAPVRSPYIIPEPKSNIIQPESTAGKWESGD